MMESNGYRTAGNGMETKGGGKFHSARRYGDELPIMKAADNSLIDRSYCLILTAVERIPFRKGFNLEPDVELVT